MDKKYLLSSFDMSKLSFEHTHTAGQINFSRPCIGYVLKGMGKFLYKGKTYYAKAGDLVYIAQGTQYYSIWYSQPEVEWYSISFSFNSYRTFYDYRFQIIKNYPSDLFDKMYFAHQQNPLLSSAYFNILLDDLYSRMKIEKVSPQFLSIEPAINYIENNFSADISISFLAELCNYSESSMYKLFKSVTGVTPITYKHNIMIQHALDLLQNTDLPIDVIGNNVGFSSANYFRKVFFTLTGKKPGEIRKNSTNGRAL